MPPHCNPHHTVTSRGQRESEKPHRERTVGQGCGGRRAQGRRVVESLLGAGPRSGATGGGERP